MEFWIEAACGCDTGRVRRNNEDNFCFGIRFLPREHKGLAEIISCRFRTGRKRILGVFDGMGGEQFGEAASFAGARRLWRENLPLLNRREMSRKDLEKLVQELNNAVVKAGRALRVHRMGTTLAMVCFSRDRAMICNVGDSRVYRLRNGGLEQLSKDHVMRIAGKRKTPLTQNLGIDPEEMLIEPDIREEMLEKNDRYLLCSDGLTDMLADSRIQEIMNRKADPGECVRELIRQSLERGGRDNVTAMVCRIE